MVELPLELIGAIIDLLPYNDSLWSSPSPEEKLPLLTCTAVSRSFSQPARRRLFSTFVIRKFEKRPNFLQELFEQLQRPDFLKLIRTLKLHVVEGNFWALGSKDPLVQRVLAVFNEPYSRVQHLCLECPSSTIFIDNFGQLAQQELRLMAPRLQALSIRGVATPITWLESGGHLESIRLVNSPLDGNKAKAQLPLPHHLDEVVFRHQKQVENFCLVYSEHRQELPTFDSVRLELSKPYGSSTLRGVLQRSSNVLRTLEITSFSNDGSPALDDVDVELGCLEKLRTLRIIYDHATPSLFRCTKGFLFFVNAILHCSKLPSTITDLELIIFCQGKYEELVWPHPGESAPTEELVLQRLHPRKLTQRHPCLHSINITFDFSQLQFPTMLLINKEDAQNSLETRIRASFESAILGIDDTDAHRHVESSPPVAMGIHTSWATPSPWEIYRY